MTEHEFFGLLAAVDVTSATERLILADAYLDFHGEEAGCEWAHLLRRTDIPVLKTDTDVLVDFDSLVELLKLAPSVKETRLRYADALRLNPSRVIDDPRASEVQRWLATVYLHGLLTDQERQWAREVYFVNHVFPGENLADLYEGGPLVRIGFDGELAVWWWDVTDEIGFSSVEPLVIARTLFDGLRTDLRLPDIRRRAGLEPYPRDFENNTELTDGD